MHKLAAIIFFLLVLAGPGAAQQIGGYTQMSVTRQHGTQISYLSESGKTFLWYPGNAIILEGRWKREGENMCFAYGENTYNPATGHQGGGWQCMSFRLYWGAVEERLPGDLFALQTRGEVPFQLDRERTTLEKLLARVSPGTDAPPLEMAVINGDGDTVSMSCASIIATAENSKALMAEAVSTYFHGIFMGKPCVEVDYDRAYELATMAGISFEPWARVLRERAESGNPLAKSAIRRLGL